MDQQARFPLMSVLHPNSLCVRDQGLQQLLPSLLELDRGHLEHGRGCRRGGNITGRSNLLHVQQRFSEDLAAIATANLANIALF